MRRGRGWPAWAAVAVATVMALSGCGAGTIGAVPSVAQGQPAPGSGSVSGGTAPAAGAVVPAWRGLPGCTLPSLPAVGSSPAGLAQMVLGGPAVGALRGGAAGSAFSLDGGDLTVAPPRAGDRPAVPVGQAECAALASLNFNNAPLLGSALQGGVAVGYGRVSVAPGLLSASPHGAYSIADAGGGSSAPTLLPPSAYQQRLAWVVVVREVLVSSCPMMPATATATAPKVAAVPSDYGYGVFLVDARTGADALLYVEGYPQPCGGPGRVAPSVTVPAEQVSVPWTLVSRSPDGYSGQVSATVLPCDGYPHTVLVDRDRPDLGVVVLRPVGPACGQPSQVGLGVHAATVTSNLPAQIGHDPVGLYIPLPSPQPSAPPTASATGVLRNLGPADNGTTIQIGVGTVLAIAPLMGVDHLAPSPVVSSDPAILGPLDGPNRSPVGEFRAWHAGHADLSVPTSGCHSPDRSVAPCSGAWIVHVEIH